MSDIDPEYNHPSQDDYYISPLDTLRSLITTAKAIQADIDAAGLGKPAAAPEPQELTPLTSEEWIAGLAYKASSDLTVQRVVRDHLLYLRHFYEDDRQQLHARIAELEALLAEFREDAQPEALAGLERLLATSQEMLALLRQNSAEQWQPVDPIKMANDEYADAEIKLCYRRVLTPPTDAPTLPA